MRIIAGNHKGRKIFTPDSPLVRPTTDRTREGLFNILENSHDIPSLEGAYILDCFAGSGAVGLEALSRGAKHATFIEKLPASLKILSYNIANLKETENTNIIAGNALSPPKAPFPYQFVFIDPPYDEGLAPGTLKALLKKGWIDHQTICIIETRKTETFSLLSIFTLLFERIYGEAKILFFKAETEEK